MRKLVVGTRGSTLALKQVDIVTEALMSTKTAIEVERLIVHTEGDRRTDVTLEQLGASVDEVVLYEAQPPAEPDEAILERIRWGEIGIATFASSSSIRNLATLLDGDLSGLYGATIACIGPLTAATAREYHLDVHVEPAEHTIPALVEALKAHFKTQ